MPDIISRKDALARSLVRYFTGKRCTYGHIAEHWTSNGNCVECAQAVRQTPQRKEFMRLYARRRVLGTIKVAQTV
jgi:hypothetical protein